MTRQYLEVILILGPTWGYRCASFPGRSLEKAAENGDLVQTSYKGATVLEAALIQTRCESVNLMPAFGAHQATCEEPRGGALRFIFTFSPNRSSEVLGNVPGHYLWHEVAGCSTGCASAHRSHSRGLRARSRKVVLPAAILCATPEHLLLGAGRRK
ncbi:hypothetical protein HPB48_018943 [Haemaphysalis longicornis]|uniref:Uncharacterized protein n=1 Tax=Haemaphysalis longicornis TaxID=44386 RepID=A0A9J6FQV7_HAELO|nr:hypothetical protein HPB48_018943 [Haemaphysalis longicornis]